MKTYTVYYWIGGRETGEWRKCLPVTDRAEADRLYSEIRRGGRVAHLTDTILLDAIGLPEGPPSEEQFRAVKM